MRYRQLKWTNAFFLLRNTVACFFVLICLFYQFFKQYSSILDLILLLMIVFYGFTNTYAFVQNVRRKIPPF